MNSGALNLAEGAYLKPPLNKAIIPHSNSKFAFPLPFGAGSRSDWIDWPNPPFLNRQEAMLQLLNDCWTNVSGNEMKAVVIATAPGYGKSRFMAEWAIQVFHDPIVLQAFIQHTDVSNVKQKKKQSIDTFLEDYIGSMSIGEKISKTDRIRLLGSLHETMSKSLILSASLQFMENVKFQDPKDDKEVLRVTDLLCRRIVIGNICERFEGQHILNGAQISIPKTWNPQEGEDIKWLKENRLWYSISSTYSHHRLEAFFSLMDLFIALVNNKNHHYKSIGNRFYGQLILVNLDEAQSILTLEAKDKTLAFYVIQTFQTYAETYELSLAKVHVLLAGNHSSSFNKLIDRKLWTNIHLSLNPLTAENFQVVVRNIFGSPLPLGSQKIVHVMWIWSLGIPRAVQLVHHTLHKFKHTLEQPHISHDEANQVLDTLRNLLIEHCYSHDIGTEAADVGLSQLSQHRLLLELGLCIPKSIVQKSTHTALEGKGVIFPFKFDVLDSWTKESSRLYTLPFHFHGPKLTDKSAEFWEGNVQLENFESVHPTFKDIVGTNGLEESSSNLKEQLVKATAASIWARYQVHASDQFQYVDMQRLVSDWRFIRLNGIRKSPKQITVETRRSSRLNKDISNTDWNFEHLLPSLCQAQVVIINHEPGSNFADVLVPILNMDWSEMQALQSLANCVKDGKVPPTRLIEAEAKYKKFLLIQCKCVPDKLELQPSAVMRDFKANKMLKLLDQGHMLIQLIPYAQQRLPCPETDPAFKGYEYKIVISKGEDWLSRLFIFASGFQVNCNETGQKKRKADCQDDTEEKKVKKTRAN